MPDENRVFDVSKPSRVSPSPTSRPVIVGHHPMNDPMVTGDNSFGSENPHSPMKISVTDGEESSNGTVTVEQAMAAHQEAEVAASQPQETPAADSPAIFHEPEEAPADAPLAPEPEQPAPSESVGEGPFTEVSPDQPADPQSDLPPAAPAKEPHIEGLHFAQPTKKGGKAKWYAGGLVVALVAIYLLLDAGAFGLNVNLPVHIFKKKAQPVATQPPTTAQPAQTASAVPAGYKKYTLADTNITFAAPVAWGDPTSATDPGYSQRGGTNQPSGTYAYLVNFATNKDIQVAVTSNKLLPAARAALYYDNLQWCTGSSDKKIYLSVLNFSTANKVDTPTTVTCNQGPVDASQLDDSTIVQLKTTDSAKSVIGDVYTLNTKDPDLVVFRVKDAAMTNGDAIKQLLKTVKVTSTTNSTSGSGQ